ncbi:hypothetical protein [Actinoplanes teichomyceticus]|uniref:Uncharacterized protein n=1 Tax=Actinoplanes teichomyceticus TaxID=1867 RepID=A0A561WIC2_ACTTI|nr:hypothetical protein [Actinoplanes teichomyceticus]TWG23604.1 hypothetical protein FHX34_102153 [Actinoplanes teichomyceticus]GIF11642.1 hypothetical protein Ate01nite_16740 [Actinoplanes teichomyceticus]
MTGSPLDDLPAQRRAEVVAAVTAVETAERPVPHHAFRALAEAPLRLVVEQMLAQAGRVLLRTEAGYLSGYDDAVVSRFAEEGIGILPADDRAVLTLVVLFAVAIPRAERPAAAGFEWTQAEPIARALLSGSRLKERVIDAALQRLSDARIVARSSRGIAPGPQFNRLTKAASERIFEELILLAEPMGGLAQQIRRRRHARSVPTPQEYP